MKNLKVKSISIDLEIDGEEKTISVPVLKTSKSAVYFIRNRFTNDLYIGQSTDYKSRWKRHIKDLVTGIHHSSLMQEHWNLFKEQNKDCDDLVPYELFDFRVICFVRPSYLYFIETAIIRQLHPSYNKKEKELTTDEIMLDFLTEG